MPTWTAVRTVGTRPNPADTLVMTSAYRWIILLMVWCRFLRSFIDRLIWTTVGASAANSFRLSLAALGSFVCAFYIGYIASTALAGLASDRLGPRVTLTFALIPLGLLAFGFTTEKSAPAVKPINAMGGRAGSSHDSPSRTKNCLNPLLDRVEFGSGL
jgi:sugar phosphate permease